LNVLANWPAYLSPLAANVLPMSAATFMHVIGIVEMVVGAIILAGYCEVGGYVAAVWLIGIAGNLVTTGQYFDVAIRDVAMAVAAFTLARLTEAGVGVEAFGHADTRRLRRSLSETAQSFCIARHRLRSLHSPD
jgi:hypothetical protein